MNHFSRDEHQVQGGHYDVAKVLRDIKQKAKDVYCNGDGYCLCIKLRKNAGWPECCR